MSEYHDTNERDTDRAQIIADRQHEHQSGQALRFSAEEEAKPATDHGKARMVALVARPVYNSGNQWFIAGFMGLPFQAGGYESLPPQPRMPASPGEAVKS
jgi:hypothetical protein